MLHTVNYVHTLQCLHQLALTHVPKCFFCCCFFCCPLWTVWKQTWTLQCNFRSVKNVFHSSSSAICLCFSTVLSIHQAIQAIHIQLQLPSFHPCTELVILMSFFFNLLRANCHLKSLLAENCLCQSSTMLFYQWLYCLWYVLFDKWFSSLLQFLYYSTRRRYEVKNDGKCCINRYLLNSKLNKSFIDFI